MVRFMSNDKTQNQAKDLFVYGTLIFDGVLESLLGYIPNKQEVVVSGYVARNISLEGWEPFPVLLKSDEHSVSGYILENLTEQDFIRLDCYEFTDREYYFRKPLAVAGRDSVCFYEPAKNLLDIGVIGDVWDTSELDPLLESIYVDSVVPKFKRDNPNLFK